MTHLEIRRAGELDARAIADLLNEVIEVGGTTAFTDPMKAKDIIYMMRNAPRNAWHLAEDQNGELLGFQWIDQVPDLPSEAANIATFARVGKTGLGIGSKLFEATKAAAKSMGYTWINANIRSDNTGGLIYYQSRGFENYGKIRGVTLADGTQVEKTLKRFDL